MKNHPNPVASEPHYLILFDIDGTLVRMTRGLPGGLFTSMVRDVFGKEIDLSSFSFAGKTDRGIISEIGDAAGLTRQELEDKWDEATEYICRGLDERISKETLRLLPNVLPLLETLDKRTDTTLAVLTGNLPACAEIKLAPYDLGRFFKFGVYGVESEDRNDLGPIALERAIEFLDGRPLKSEHVVVIGDSVRDVECAKAIDARVIVTLTSSTTRDEVEPLGPDFVFEDLSDTKKVLEAIYGKE